MTADASSWKPIYKSLSDITILIEDVWELEHAGGPRSARITIGRPSSFRDPGTGAELFACPFYVEGATDNIVTAVGEGPLNALMSAVVAIRRIFKYPD